MSGRNQRNPTDGHLERIRVDASTFRLVAPLDGSHRSKAIERLMEDQSVKGRRVRAEALEAIRRQRESRS